MPKPKKDIKKGNWDKKKTAIVRHYSKIRGSNTGKYNVSGSNQQENNHSKTAFFDKAMQEYERRRAFREEKKQMREAKQKEKDEATKKYIEKKRENFKKLSAKTKWGQPVMKGRMEILLERIQKSVNTDAGAEKFCKVRVNIGSNATVPYSQLLDLRSVQSLHDRAASESPAEFLKGLPSHNETNFSRFQPDTSFKSSMKKASVYLPTEDHPAEKSKLITTDKTTILLRYLQQQYERKANQRIKRETERGGPSCSSDYTPRKKTRVDKE